MPMDAILVTGFPGFLASALVPRLLARAPYAEVVCLVQLQHAVLARQRVQEIVAAQPALDGRIAIVHGDVTQRGLGITDLELPRRVTELFHLAAIYDLAVDRELALRVNVGGTQHALAFARACPRLARFHYVSTCFVSGRWRGTFLESQLEAGQTFNNPYEESKYLAELEVRAAIRGGLSATIYRPSVVVGDSVTGATQKYDGPYYVLQWLLRQPRTALMPVVKDDRRREFNMVPRDYVVDAIATLSGRLASLGRTYALADAAPLAVDELLALLARATDRRLVRVPLRLGLAKAMLDHLPGAARLLRIPSEALDYFVHPTHYDTANTRRDLAESGVACPPVSAYVDRLVAFIRAHPDIGPHAMR